MERFALFETNNAGRYLTALCQHFEQKVEAKCDAGKGQVKFPFGECQMAADTGRLMFAATAKDLAQLDQVIQIVSSHLDRFAFRENPLLEWRSTEQNDSTKAEIAATGEPI